MRKDQDTLMLIVCFLGLIYVSHGESDCMRIVLQVALTAGEQLLTSVSTFDKTHCIAQDLTIGKSKSYWALKYILQINDLKKKIFLKSKKQGVALNLF